jgi:DNA repair exonuclease SbcCD ATPase subunit
MDKSKWNTLASKTHQEQAIWFLNAFWNGGVKQHAEKIWEFRAQFQKLGPNACELDEFFSHKFLEDCGETMTVVQLRAKLAEIDIDKNKKMCISEYLLFKFGKTAAHLVDAPQGDPKELQAAQALVDEASRALDEVLEQLEQQKRVAAQLAEAERQAQAAKAAAEEATNEQKAAAAELQAQEDAYHSKIADLEKKSQEGGVVSRNKAKAELEQVKAEDPLPLRKAKLNQEAAVRKTEKAEKAALEKLKAAEAARAAAEEVARKLEIASKEAEAKRDEALAFLEKVKASGAGAGQVWWLQREMYEKQHSLPKAKQTMAYPKPE